MSSLYIHIPFCHKKCFYCSFVVSIGQDKKQNRYLNCLAKEGLAYRGMEVDSVYVGGGTPTLLETENLVKLFQFIYKNFRVKDGGEITIESNPEGLAKDKLAALLDCGVNRISLGIQSLNDKYLKYLGRNHNRDLALKAYDDIRAAGFLNVNCDLMYTFPGQTLSEIEEDVQAILALKSQHLSLYTLTIEERSRFFTKGVQLDRQEQQARQFSLIVSLLEKAGFLQYEVSNFSREGFQSEHNINYWQAGDYVGLGVGAHSHINGRRFWNGNVLGEYLKQVENSEGPLAREEILTREQRFAEHLLFGLRMKLGVDVEAISKKYNFPIDQVRKETIALFIREGLLKHVGSRLCATQKGILVLDEISSRLI